MSGHGSGVRLVRPGRHVLARPRAAPRLLSDRVAGRHADNPRKGDRQALLPRSRTRTYPPDDAGTTRRAGRGRTVEDAPSLATAPADAGGREAAASPRKSGTAARRCLRGPPLDRRRDAG